MGKLYKAPVRLRSVHRGENAVRGHAMRGPEPRALELEIPRPLGAGVGALDLVFELGVCPECGGRLIESNGLLVCGNCARNAFMTTFGSFTGERAEQDDGEPRPKARRGMGGGRRRGDEGSWQQRCSAHRAAQRASAAPPACSAGGGRVQRRPEKPNFFFLPSLFSARRLSHHPAVKGGSPREGELRRRRARQGLRAAEGAELAGQGLRARPAACEPGRGAGPPARGGGCRREALPPPAAPRGGGWGLGLGPARAPGSAPPGRRLPLWPERGVGGVAEHGKGPRRMSRDPCGRPATV